MSKDNTRRRTGSRLPSASCAASVAAVLMAVVVPSSAAAGQCVLHGREIRNLEHITCTAAKPVLQSYLLTLKTARAWHCQGYRRQTWRGYCETVDGRRYFTWRQLA